MEPHTPSGSAALYYTQPESSPRTLFRLRSWRGHSARRAGTMPARLGFVAVFGCGFAALWAGQSRLQPAFSRRVHSRSRGFTFVELMVVVSIIVILISVAVPSYTTSLVRAKESVLKNNLFTLRSCIDSVAFDRGKAPQDLRDLVSAGCLAKVPTDPITNTPNWRTIPEDPSQAVSQSEPGIFDVRSTSDKIGLDRTPYADW